VARTLNKKEAYKMFMEYDYPAIVEQYGRDDRIAIREGWNNFTDFLCKDGRITEHQDYTWSNPF